METKPEQPGEKAQDRYAHQFDIGDVVWVLRGNQRHAEFYICPGCNGEGEFRIETLLHNRVTCPDCRGRGRVWLDSEVRFYTLQERTIGQVTVEVTTNAPWGGEETRRATEVAGGHWRTVSYMTYETGIGSGSVYYESACFPSEVEAVAHAEAQGWVTEEVAKSPKQAVLAGSSEQADS